MERVATQTDHFVNTFCGGKVAHGYVNIVMLRFTAILFGEIQSMNQDILMYFNAFWVQLGWWDINRKLTHSLKSLVVFELHFLFTFNL